MQRQDRLTVHQARTCAGPVMQHPARVLALAICAALVLLPTTSGQGLSLEGGTVRLASPEVFASFRALRSASDAWKGTWAGGSPAAACSTDPSSPCGRANANDLALLEVAASPAAYDASKLRGPGGTPLFLPAGDQRPCFSCVGFAVAAAARAAYVSALPDGAEGSVPGISEHDLQHCGSGATRTCTSNWNLPDALRELTQRPLTTSECLPYTADSSPGGPAEKCRRECRRTSHRAFNQGKFEYVPLKSVWEVQRHIRRHGAVLTRFDIYQAFRDFYKAGGNARKVYIHRNTSSSRSGVEGHAVVLVGYNLTEGTWKVRNSWGVAWGDQGYFRIPFDAPGILAPDDTFGVVWKSNQPRWLLPRLVPAQTPGCYMYKAQPGDFLTRVSHRTGGTVRKLLLDNQGVLANLEAPLAGVSLTLCDVNAPPRALPQKVREAAIADTLGFSLGTPGTLTAYTLGVMSIMERTSVGDLLPDDSAAGVAQEVLERRLLRPGVTRVSGCGEGAFIAAGLCSGIQILPQQVQLFVGMGDRFRADPRSCYGKIASAHATTAGAFPWPQDAHVRCRDKAFISITFGKVLPGAMRIPEGRPNPLPATHVLVSNFSSVPDLVGALRASSFVPLEDASGAGETYTFRNQSSYAGYMSEALPPCAPGTTYCVTVSALPAPEVAPRIGQETGSAILKRLGASGPGVPSPPFTLSDLLGPEAAAGGQAQVLGAHRAARSSMTPEVAWDVQKLGVDIAPNLLVQLVGLDSTTARNWRMMQALTGTSEVEIFLFMLGQADAAAWAQYIKSAAA